MISAIVLAGGQKKGVLQGEGPVQEAMIPLGKSYMINYVVNALLESSILQKVIVAGPVHQLQRIVEPDPRVFLTEGGLTTTGSAEKAFSLLNKTEDYVLIATADIPLLTARAVDDFINTCLKQQGDFFYPVISQGVIERKYGEVKRTYVKLKEGVFTGGNLFLVKTGILEKCMPQAEKFVRLRKKPLQLALLVGWTLCLRYLTGRLSISEAEEKVSALLGVKGVAIISPYPEIGLDVDKYSDYEAVNRAIGC